METVMLGSIKNKMGDSMMQKAIDKFSPEIEGQLKKITDMRVEDVRSDENFKLKFISPAIIAVSAASSGAIKLIPQFDIKFTNALLNVRNELVYFDVDKIHLVEGFEKRLPEVLMQGFKE
jgi:hypothetical protein